MNPDRVYKAFSDPTRRRALRLLSGGALCVCDITDALKLPQPTVSRHLAALQDAGLVEVERRGKWRHYALAAKTPLVRGLLKTLPHEASSERVSPRRC